VVLRTKVIRPDPRPAKPAKPARPEK